MECGIKNTFAASLYSTEYTFPVLLLIMMVTFLTSLTMGHLVS
jgi:hypothetical protein